MILRLATVLALSSLALAPIAAQAEPESAEEPVHDPVGFGAGQPIPATLTLNYSEDGRDARMTPVRNNCRPKVVFNGSEVICMMRMERGAEVAPGESGEVRLECKDPVVVARAGTRHLVVESGKKVGFVDIHLPPVPAD